MTENITIKQLTAQTTLSSKSSISILNNSADSYKISVKVSGSSNSIQLDVGQSVTFTSSTGFFLPDIIVDLVGASMVAEVVYS